MMECDLCMRLTILGMNGPFPAAGGATSGYLLECAETAFALDMGCGTLPRLTALTAPESLDALILSHWHYDHCADVLPLLYRLESRPTGSAPLHLYAPVDEASPVRKAVQACKAVVLHDLRPGDSFTVGDVRVETFAARHPVPALMLRITHEGRVFCYTGDTNTVEGLTAFAHQADLLLADGLFTEGTWGEGKPHLSASLVAQLAVDASVRQLLITHLNPTIDPETLLREARAIRTDAALAAIGDRYTI